MKHAIVRCICIGFLGLTALSGTAAAQSEAYTNAPANLRAGPAPDYPLVAAIPAGTLVSVIGCLGDYSWCDVALPGVRGWIYAGRLSYPYEGGDVAVLDYGAWIGYPVVTFALVPYWDHFYRNRPWFNDRDRWMHRAEPRLGPGGIPPGRGHPQIGQAPAGAVGGGTFGRDRDVRPSMPHGGFNGGVRSPGPQGNVGTQAPQAGGGMYAPGPNAGGGMHAPGPPAGGAVHVPSATMGGAVIGTPPQGRQGGGGSGGERGFGRQGGGGGGRDGGGGGERGFGLQGGGGGGGDHGTDFRR